MSKKSKSGSQNYLKFIPLISDAFHSETDSEGLVTIYIENKGFFNFIAQKLLKKPRISQIHLDRMGNFIWPLMDGQKNIIDIADAVKKEFGDEAEPLYKRLLQYMKMLEDNGFIVMDKSHCDE